MAIGAVAQPPVLDTNGEQLESGREYYILGRATHVTGGLTMINPNNTCPFYVGQLAIAPIAPESVPTIMFQPYAFGETIIRESRDLSVKFQTIRSQAVIRCTQSPAWRVGKDDPVTRRRFIMTGNESEADFFAIERSRDGYNLLWCPTESCRACGRPKCGYAGILTKDETRFLVLDGPALSFRFLKV